MYLRAQNPRTRKTDILYRYKVIEFLDDTTTDLAYSSTRLDPIRSEHPTFTSIES
jgi:hypothetical protein